MILNRSHLNNKIVFVNLKQKLELSDSKLPKWIAKTRLNWLELVLKNKKANRFTFDSRIDYGLILPAFMLILIGLYALYVAVSHDHPTQATNLVVQQGTWVIVGLFV